MGILSKLFKTKKNLSESENLGASKNNEKDKNDLDKLDEINELQTKGRDLATQGSYNQARSCFEKVLTLQKKVIGKQHPDLATTFSNIGFALDGLNEYKEAIVNYEKALVIRRKASGSDSPEIAIILNNIGLSWLALNPYKSKEYLEKALSIMVKDLGNDHPQTRQTASHLTEIKKNLSR